MENLPFYIPSVFIVVLLVILVAMHKAVGNSRVFLLVVLFWVIVQTIISLSGFYTVSDTTPPRILLLTLPPIVVILLIFATKRGRQFVDRTDIRYLTLVHTLRIPVEFVLLWLYYYKTIPQLMTFEGNNFDILSGLTAPVVYYFAFVKKRLNRQVLLMWNLVCLGLLINVVIHGILSTPGKLQQFAFEQPNIAIQYFPFSLLPGCIVPLILFAHLATIRKIFVIPQPY